MKRHCDASVNANVIRKEEEEEAAVDNYSWQDQVFPLEDHFIADTKWIDDYYKGNEGPEKYRKMHQINQLESPTLPQLPEDVLIDQIMNWVDVSILMSCFKNVSRKWYYAAYRKITVLSIVPRDPLDWITDLRPFTKLNTLVYKCSHTHAVMIANHLDAVAMRINYLYIINAGGLMAQTLSMFSNLTLLYLSSLDSMFDAESIVNLKYLRVFCLTYTFLDDYHWLSRLSTVRHLILDNSYHYGKNTRMSLRIPDHLGTEIDNALMLLVNLETLILSYIPTTLAFIKNLTNLRLLNINNIKSMAGRKNELYQNIDDISKLTHLKILLMPRKLDLDFMDPFLHSENLSCLTTNYIDDDYTLLSRLPCLKHIHILIDGSQELSTAMCKQLSSIPKNINITISIRHCVNDDEASLRFLGFLSIIAYLGNQPLSSLCCFGCDYGLITHPQDLITLCHLRPVYNILNPRLMSDFKSSSELRELMLSDPSGQTDDHEQ